MDDADAVDPVGDLRQHRVIPTGEDVDLVPEGREVPGDLADVDVLAAAVDAAQERKGRGVLADDRDPFAHADTG